MNNLNFNLEKIRKKVQTEIFVYDMHSKEARMTKERSAQIAEILEKPLLRVPIIAITQEFLANALKAVYKKIFFEEMIPTTIQVDQINYKEKLRLFRLEIEKNQTKNFTHIAKKNNLYVTFKFEAKKEGLKLLVINPGTPTSIEMYRIKKHLEDAKKISSLSHIFENDKDMTRKENYKEGAGLGLALVIMSLKNLKTPLNNMDIYKKGNQTFSKILFPWDIFFNNDQV